MEDLLYWSDQAAQDIINQRGLEHTVATGITPSGPIHIGNIREVLTGHALYLSLIDLRATARFIYIADTFDPLRKVYPFLSQKFEQYIGWPLYRIPDPEGCCSNYAEHFLKPFFNALKELGIEPEILRAHELAKAGVYSGVIRTALERVDLIKEVIEKVTGRKLPQQWYPFQAECSECSKITDTKIIGLDLDQSKVNYQCSCGQRGESDFSKGEGKLLWRIDWPARWKALGVTVEPFGKDHASAGGSYETGREISRQVFDYEPPYPCIYEWIYLKGKGAMASSTGVAISAEEMLKVVQPEVLRYLILRMRPEKHIDFEPSYGMIKIIDEYQALENGIARRKSSSFEKRIFAMSAVNRNKPVMELPLSFTHLAVLVQIAHGDIDDTFKIIERNGYKLNDDQKDFYRRLVVKSFNWLDSFAPEEFKFEVSPVVPDAANELSELQRKLLKILAEKISHFDREETALPAEEKISEHLHGLVYEVGNDLGLKPQEAFSAVYKTILGKSSGPRAGFFLASLDREFVIKRFMEI